MGETIAQAYFREIGAPSSTNSPQTWNFFRIQANDRFEPLTRAAKLKDKVVLYVHGWQPGHNTTGFDGASLDEDDSHSNRREFPAVSEGFVTPSRTYGGRHDCLTAWREAGYDTVAFCWAPLADETSVLEAERKIWDEQEGKQHLTWKCPGCAGCEGTGACVAKEGKKRKLDEELGTCVKGYRSEFAPPGSLGRVLSDAWEILVKSCGRPSYLHLVGHSLGCQLSCNFIRQQLQLKTEGRGTTSSQVVQRWTLLDPYFSNFAKSWLGGRWTGQVVREVARAVADAGTPVEQYRSSKVLDNPLSDSNDELLLVTAYFIMEPKFIAVKGGPSDFEALTHRHSSAKYIYFRSKECSPPAEVQFKKPVGPWEPVADSPGGGYASSSDARIRALMGPDSYWYHIGGTDTPDPALHTYERRKGPSNSRFPVLAGYSASPATAG